MHAYKGINSPLCSGRDVEFHFYGGKPHPLQCPWPTGLVRSRTIAWNGPVAGSPNCLHSHTEGRKKEMWRQPLIPSHAVR